LQVADPERCDLAVMVAVWSAAKRSVSQVMRRCEQLWRGLLHRRRDRINRKSAIASVWQAESGSNGKFPKSDPWGSRRNPVCEVRRAGGGKGSGSCGEETNTGRPSAGGRQCADPGNVPPHWAGSKVRHSNKTLIRNLVLVIVLGPWAGLDQSWFPERSLPRVCGGHR